MALSFIEINSTLKKSLVELYAQQNFVDSTSFLVDCRRKNTFFTYLIFLLEKSL